MSEDKSQKMLSLMTLLFKAHPWHGVSIGDNAPATVTAYIEIVPTDTVKYEIDKATGLLKIDRPQQFSNVCPTLYGFIPQTLCGPKVGEFCGERTGRAGIVGDRDPLDICVLTEKTIPHGDVLLQAIPIGGLRMLDRQEADDKIIAIMQQDVLHGSWQDITDCPAALIDRLRHYFLTYKNGPNATERRCEITHVYNREEAYRVIQLSQEDYTAQFGDPASTVAALIGR